MTIDTQDGTHAEFLDILNETSSVFFYNEENEIRPFMELLIKEIRNEEPLPVIHITWNECESLNDHSTIDCSTDDITSLHLFRNLTGTMIKIDKMLSKNRHLIIVQDLSTLKTEKDNKPYIHFLAVLIRKCMQHESTLIAIENQVNARPEIRDCPRPYFTNEFILQHKRIKKSGKKPLDIRYEIKEGILYIEPCLQSDMNKLKEIFSLTPEEKKELDRIVGQSLEEYRTYM
ncbi:hypothetical protein [Methanolobus sp. WCC5]|uniref:hypothetical protein n=1 Tax=Methanolobus sp. WCC5 TaxID=3125785 RepID=UPI00324A096C